MLSRNWLRNEDDEQDEKRPISEEEYQKDSVDPEVLSTFCFPLFLLPPLSLYQSWMRLSEVSH